MEPTIRNGELSAQSLVDALTTERASGRRPNQLVVGSSELEQAALQILAPTPGTLGDLLAVVPNVIVDAGRCRRDEWELRER